MTWFQRALGLTLPKCSRKPKSQGAHARPSLCSQLYLLLSTYTTLMPAHHYFLPSCLLQSYATPPLKLHTTSHGGFKNLNIRSHHPVANLKSPQYSKNIQIPYEAYTPIMFPTSLPPPLVHMYHFHPSQSPVSLRLAFEELHCAPPPQHHMNIHLPLARMCWVFRLSLVISQNLDIRQYQP